MEKPSNSVSEYGQFLSVILASALFGSILILSAVGPARASEVANHDCPAAAHYLA